MLRFLRFFAYVRQLEMDLQKERDAQAEISRQLFAERELRKAADARADTYHAEAREAYQKSIDWFAQATLTRKPIFAETGEVAPSEAPKPIIPSKPTARGIARQIEHETLRELAEELKRDRPTGILPVLDQVRMEGPEYASR